MPEQKEDILGLAEANSLEQGFDPALQHLQADEPASEEEEELAGAGLVDMMDFAFSEQGLANIVQALEQSPDELYTSVPQVVVPMLQRAKEKVDAAAQGNTAPPSVFFGEGGLITQAVDIVFDIADQIQVPGFDDPDQYAAALMGTFKTIGESILDSGDENAIRETNELAEQMALTNPDGTERPRDFFSKKNELSASVEEGLLGVQ